MKAGEPEKLIAVSTSTRDKLRRIKELDGRPIKEIVRRNADRQLAELEAMAKKSEAA